MAHKTASVLFLIRTNLMFFHPFADDGKDRLINLCPKHTILHRNDAVCARRIKACDHMPFLVRSNRKLRLVTITVRLIHSDNRKHDSVHFFLRKSTEADQIISHLLILECKLLIIRKSLNLTTSATSVQRAFRLYSMRGRTLDLLHPRISIIFLHFRRTRNDLITD